MRVVGRKTARLVAGQIIRDIADEGLEVLPPESALMDRYEVSRPSLREALRILEMYGVLTIRPGPGGGMRVNAVASEQYANASSLYFHILGLTLRDVLNTRLQMEPLMARLAAQKARSGGKWPDQPSDGGSGRDSFHFSVAQFAGDPILILFADALRNIYVDESSGEYRFDDDLSKLIPITHEQIQQAIESGDAAKAEELMREHITRYAQLLEDNYPQMLDQVVEWR
ncbi:FadR/GntR family transcriptional regulator [Mycolicibacterium porcinum]|uniref:FadR/GntR family transcriptional regulator n=1 Tax=Mycolicibacterium porcinum TaxID=39693 RepID=UPI00256EB5CF|nr:FCD domain-containing protein [Mycolicibacterium porcinum]